jgi:hypothetical protein
MEVVMSVGKLAVILFIVASVVFAGTGLLVVTSVPSLYDGGMQLIPYVVLGGFALAALASVIVANQILKPN